MILGPILSLAPVLKEGKVRMSPPYDHLGVGLSGTVQPAGSACTVSYQLAEAVVHADACLHKWAVRNQGQQ